MANKKLKSLRAEYGYKQCDMAKLLDISTTAYTDKENGHFEFKEKEINFILEHFNVQYEDIFLN